MKAFTLEHRALLDDDSRFCNALDDRAWAAFYLEGRSGRVGDRFHGETREGDAQARAIEAAIARLLTEPGSAS